MSANVVGMTTIKRLVYRALNAARSMNPVAWLAIYVTTLALSVTTIVLILLP